MQLALLAKYYNADLFEFPHLTSTEIPRSGLLRNFSDLDEVPSRLLKNYLSTRGCYTFCRQAVISPFQPSFFVDNLILRRQIDGEFFKTRWKNTEFFVCMFSSDAIID